MIMSPKSWTLLAILALFVAAPAAAQKPAAVEIGGFGQWTHFDDNAGRANARPEDGFGYGGRLGVFLSRNWQVEADGYYSPQDRKVTEEFCCLGLFPDEVNASAFALRLNYNIPLGTAGRSQLIFGGGAVRTKYAFRGGNTPDSSMADYGASGLAGLRVALLKHVALRVDGVADYMPNHEPEANMNLHLRAGISLLLGGSQAAAPVSVMRPAPPPPPAPLPPATVPTPAPIENAITVCIIDPSQPSGIRTQSALYRELQRDTVVMQNGNRVALSQVTGSAMVARDATWYNQGKPLQLMIGTRPTWYLAYGSARQMDADRMAFLGTINGYPAYAERDQVASLIGAFDAARAANPNRDLGVVLADRRDLHDAVEALPFIYVPLQRTNCVFQPMQLMPMTIKNR
jgi:hypothetical protein